MISVFYGTDTFRSRAAFRAACDRAAADAGTAVTVLRDGGVSPQSLSAAVGGQSLFRDVPPIAVEELTLCTGPRGAAVARVLNTARSRTLLVWEPGLPATNGVVWRALTQCADRLLAFAPLGTEALRQWVTDRVAAAGSAITDDARQLLVETGGADLWRLASEVDKLLLLVTPAAGGRGAASQRTPAPITRADVTEVVPLVFRGDLFATVRALVGGQVDHALRLLTAFRRAGEDSRRLLSTVVRDLQHLVRVRGALDAGRRLGGWEVVRMLHVPKEAAEALLATARNTRTAAARALLDRCTLAYYHLNTGRATADEILDSLALASVTQTR